MKKVIIIAGPTGSGKTDLAIRLAKAIGGELINADSRQIYHGLDIGTNKGVLTPTGEFIELENRTIEAFDVENSGVPGWMFSFLEPDQEYSLANYYADVLELIDLLIACDKIPVLVGGTGLYIDALVKGYRLSDSKPDPELRERLNKIEVPELFKKLEKLAPEKAANLNESDCKNPHRLIRAIEVALQEKGTPTVAKPVPVLDCKILYPVFDREELYKKIDQRAKGMVDEGLVAETKRAIDLGYAATNPLNGMGYNAAQDFITRKINEQQLIEQVAQEHRNYVKRQITWFEGAGRAYDLTLVDFKAEINQILMSLKVNS